MSECSLYCDPNLYDMLFPGATASSAMLDAARRERLINSERFYLEEVQASDGPALEVGCGSGRLTIPIAQQGVEIVGLDLSEPMLARARAKAEAVDLKVEFVHGDMRSFDLARKFSTVIIPGNSLLHMLTINDLKQCLASVQRHLAPNGRLIFDISHWDMQVLARDHKQRFPVLRAQYPNGGELTIEETAQYNDAEQVRDVQWHISTPESPDSRRIDYRLRVIFPQELLLLLEAAGFQLQTRFGEFTGEPFNAASPRQVCICAAIEENV